MRSDSRSRESGAAPSGQQATTRKRGRRGGNRRGKRARLDRAIDRAIDSAATDRQHRWLVSSHYGTPARTAALTDELDELYGELRENRAETGESKGEPFAGRCSRINEGA